MTESLIDIGSIISIIQMSEEIIKHAYYYFHTVCEAKNNILAIINLVSGFRKLNFSESLQANRTFQRYEDDNKNCLLLSVAMSKSIQMATHQ